MFKGRKASEKRALLTVAELIMVAVLIVVGATITTKLLGSILKSPNYDIENAKNTVERMKSLAISAVNSGEEQELRFQISKELWIVSFEEGTPSVSTPKKTIPKPVVKCSDAACICLYKNEPPSLNEPSTKNLVACSSVPAVKRMKFAVTPRGKNFIDSPQGILIKGSSNDNYTRVFLMKDPSAGSELLVFIDEQGSLEKLYTYRTKRLMKGDPSKKCTSGAFCKGKNAHSISMNFARGVPEKCEPTTQCNPDCECTAQPIPFCRKGALIDRTCFCDTLLVDEGYCDSNGMWFMRKP